jgi:hypothetical protein
MGAHELCPFWWEKQKRLSGEEQAFFAFGLN